VALVLLFGPLAERAGMRSIELEATDVAGVLEALRPRFGGHLDLREERCRVWVNGEPADEHTKLAPSDEVALLPPVSGG